MRKSALILSLLALFATGCSLLSSEDDESGVVTLSGKVLNSETNNPVPGAFVRVLPFDLLFETDDEGRYEFEVSVDSTMDLRIIANSDGFSSDNVTVLALAGRIIDVPTLRIRQMVADEPVSGRASNILLLGQTSGNIGVKESGSAEVARLTFQVADSAGRPVILDHSTMIRFTLGQAPEGAFIAPEFAETDNNGQVTVNLSSGVKAGVVQLIAETEIAGKMIRSQPVSVAIHGGLPDQRHFSIGPDRFNFPGLTRYGLTDAISVIVGDKYANPVKPGTAVYFTADHGVIEGSVLTGDDGRGAVRLISANPLPADGVAKIYATTADENNQEVSGVTGVIFSGYPYVQISPAVARLNQTYTLKVTDHNGNPLSGGTVIRARAEGTKVKATGNTDVRLLDTGFFGDFTYENVVRGPGITDFVFRVGEDLTIDETGVPEVETVTVTIDGPNGTIELVLTPGGVVSQTKAAQIQTFADGSAKAWLSD